MSKMNELSHALDELRSIGEKMINISDLLRDCFSSQAEPETPQPVAPVEPEAEAPAYSFLDVRKLLSAKSRDGHTDAIKALIRKYGADKLSDLKPEHYSAVVAEAEVL